MLSHYRIEWLQRHACRGNSPIRNSAPLGPYSRTMPRALWNPKGGGLFLMSEVPLQSEKESIRYWGQSTASHFFLLKSAPPPEFFKL